MSSGRYWMRLSSLLALTASSSRVPGEQVAQVAFDLRPHALGGVELGGVGRQLNHGQPVVRVAEPVHRGAAVHVEIVPNQDDRGGELGVRGGDQCGVVMFGEAA